MSGRPALCQGADGLFPVKETASQSSVAEVWELAGVAGAPGSQSEVREVPWAAKWCWHVPPHPALKEDSSAKLLTDQKLATEASQGKDIPKMETQRYTPLLTSGQVTVLTEGGGGVRSGAGLGGPKSHPSEQTDDDAWESYWLGGGGGPGMSGSGEFCQGT